MSPSLQQISRSAIRSVLAVEQAEGVGALVRRSIGGSSLRNFSPFLMLDQFIVSKGGFPDHPHRGQTTLTYMLEGSFQHEDFVGHKGIIEAGDLQFMIAGKGIMHAEMPLFTPGGKNPMGLQLWIDLPKEHKLVEPSYQELKAAQVPSANPTPNVLIKVICGEAQGNESQGTVTSPVRSLGGCWFLDYRFSSANETIFQLIPAGWNTFIYTLAGTVSLGDDSSNPIEPFHTTILTSAIGETGIKVTSISSEARLVIVAGEPLDQEIVQYGPFVMDTKEGIQQALKDYQRGENGFERAKGWKSGIGGH